MKKYRWVKKFPRTIGEIWTFQLAFIVIPQTSKVFVMFLKMKTNYTSILLA